MAQPAVPIRSTYAEYLELERQTAQKHEFVNGEIFAMGGGSTEHARLAAAVIAELRSALRGKPCAPFSSDLRVRVEETNRSLYPDATVVCGKLETASDDPQAVTNPVVIVEVLSDSTERYDLGDKFAHYRRLPSLREVVFVSQREVRIDVYVRGDDARWTLDERRAGQTVQLSSVAVSIAVDDVYRNPLGA